MLICTKSHAEGQEEAQKEQEAQERSKKSKKEAKGQEMPCGFDLSKNMWTQRPCGPKGNVDSEDEQEEQERSAKTQRENNMRRFESLDLRAELNRMSAARIGCKPVDFGKPLAWICTKPHAEAKEEPKKRREEQTEEEAKNRREEQTRKMQAARRRKKARKNPVYRMRTPSPCEGVRMAPPGKLLTIDDMVADLLKQCDLLKQSRPKTFTVMQWKEHIAKKHEDHGYHAAMEEYERIKAMMMHLTQMGFQWQAAEQDKQRHELPVASHKPHNKQRYRLCNVSLTKKISTGM